MIELVAGDVSSGPFNLLVWDGAQAHIQPSVPLTAEPGCKFEPRVFDAPEVDSTICRAIRFPTGAAPYESSPKLFGDLCALVQKYTGLPERLIYLAAHSVLASWFPDCTAIPICLSIVGPQSNQGSQLFRLLSCLYRRPLLLAEMSVFGLRSLPMELCPALFIERYELSAQLQGFLHALNAHGAYIPRKGQLLSVTFARVVYTEEPLSDDALGASAIKIPVTPTRQPVPILDKLAQEQIADAFQPKLLMYRLANYRRVAQSDFDVSRFLPPVRELARCLGACVPGEPELQQRIISLLEERNEEVQTERATDLNSIVVEVMFSFSHEEKKQSVRVGELTTAVNAILEQRGELLELRPRTIGYRLGALGLTTKRLDAAGRGLLLLAGTRRRIHRLARDYGVPVAPSVQGCSYCERLPEAGEEDPQPITEPEERQPGFIENKHKTQAFVRELDL
jgi:hypothetical protein